MAAAASDVAAAAAAAAASGAARGRGHAPPEIGFTRKFLAAPLS